MGYPVPVFDFRLPGLTSMSCDTHKFGYGLKGNSVVLYRNIKLRRYQYFQMAHWPGGIYASPTMTGSRSGGLSASTWAAMVYLGEEGYLRAAKAIMSVADAIKKGVADIPDLRIIGDPTFIVSLRSSVVDIFHVNDYMIEQRMAFQRAAESARDPFLHDHAADHCAGHSRAARRRPPCRRGIREIEGGNES